MKWYRYWKIYLGIGIFFILSVLCASELSLKMLPNAILAVLFLGLGIIQRKKAYTDAEYVEEVERRKQEKKSAKIPHEQRYRDLPNIHTKIVGVTFNNEDGSSRQDYLCYINNREQLFLKEYSYHGDPAFYVCNRKGKCLGNLPKEISAKIKKKYSTSNMLVFVEDIHKFDVNLYNDDDYDDDEYYDENENTTEPNYIYTCKIVIYFQ